MKQIINGKTYNTETAELLGHWSNQLYGDFGYCTENLYRTKKGAYFIAGNGGPLSKYAIPCGNMTRGGSEIIPLTETEAKRWMEKYGDADEYEAAFGPAEEA